MFIATKLHPRLIGKRFGTPICAWLKVLAAIHT